MQPTPRDRASIENSGHNGLGSSMRHLHLLAATPYSCGIAPAILTDSRTRVKRVSTHAPSLLQSPTAQMRKHGEFLVHQPTDAPPPDSKTSDFFSTSPCASVAPCEIFQNTPQSRRLPKHLDPPPFPLLPSPLSSVSPLSLFPVQPLTTPPRLPSPLRSWRLCQ